MHYSSRPFVLHASSIPLKQYQMSSINYYAYHYKCFPNPILFNFPHVQMLTLALCVILDLFVTRLYIPEFKSPEPHDA
jgi:hypothetical protein